MHSYPEIKSILEKIGDEVMVSMHLHPIPARVRNHDCCHTFDDGVIVTKHVNAQQAMPINHSVVLIDAPSSPTISHKVLSTGCNFVPENTRGEAMRSHCS